MKRRCERSAGRWLSYAPGGNQGARRGGSGDASSADKLRKAAEPGLLSFRRGAVLQQLLRHEERSRRAGRRAAQRRGSTVPRRVQGGGRFLLAEVVLSVAVVVVLRVLDVGFGVDAALWGRAPARAAARVASGRSSGGTRHPASETFSA